MAREIKEITLAPETNRSPEDYTRRIDACVEKLDAAGVSGSLNIRDTPYGWLMIVEKACDMIVEAVSKTQGEAAIRQVKEKFGELRFYVSADDDELYDEVSRVSDWAEEASSGRCIITGEAGDIVYLKGWALTLSPEMAELVTADSGVLSSLAYPVLPEPQQEHGM